MMESTTRQGAGCGYGARVSGRDSRAPSTIVRGAVPCRPALLQRDLWELTTSSVCVSGRSIAVLSTVAALCAGLCVALLSARASCSWQRVRLERIATGYGAVSAVCTQAAPAGDWVLLLICDVRARARATCSGRSAGGEAWSLMLIRNANGEVRALCPALLPLYALTVTGTSNVLTSNVSTIF